MPDAEHPSQGMPAIPWINNLLRSKPVFDRVANSQFLSQIMYDPHSIAACISDKSHSRR